MQKLRERVKDELINFFRSRQWKTPLDTYEICLAFGEREKPDSVKDLWMNQCRVWLEKYFSERLKPPSPHQEPEELQMCLCFGFSGGLDESIPVSNDEVPLRDASVTDLRENLRIFKLEAREEFKAKVKAATAEMYEEFKLEFKRIVAARQSLIDEMSPYSAVNHGLKVGKFFELKTAGVPPPPLKATGKTKTRRANA